MKKQPQEIILTIKQQSLDELSRQLQDRLDRRINPVNKIPVFGGMKAGKSTLLAKLLECEQAFLPPGVLEATGKNVTVNYSFAANRSIVDPAGSAVLCESDEEWDWLVRGKKEIPAGSQLVLEVPCAFLLDNRISFVDTPGNNTVDAVKADQTWAALQDSSVCIYCLRAAELMSASDLRFITAAAHYMDNFIFVVSRIDEIGANRYDAPEAVEICNYAKSRMEQLNLHPVDIIPVSNILSADCSGIQILKDKLADILLHRGMEFKISAFLKDFQSLAGNELLSLNNKKGMLENALADGSDVFAEKLGKLNAELIDCELHKKQAQRKLSIDLEQKKLELNAAVMNAGKKAIERIKARLESILAGKDVEETGKLILLSEIDAWRQEIRETGKRLSESTDQILAQSATEFTGSLEEKLHQDLNVDFKVELTSPADYSYIDAIHENMDQMTAEKENLQKEIEDLKMQMQADENSIPELRAGIDTLQQEMDSIEYEPQMEERRYGTVNGNASEILKKIGSAADWILLFTPIPMSKLKWLNKLKYGKQIKNVIQGANKVIRAKNKFLKRTGTLIPGFDKFFEMFSVEYWAEKAGEMIDNAGSEVRLVENQEVKDAYLKAIAPYKEKQAEMANRLEAIQQKQNFRKSLLEKMERDGEQASENYRKLEQEMQDACIQMRQQQDLELLFEGKQKLMTTACSLFMCRDSALVQPVLEEFEQLFSAYSLNLQKNLDSSIDETFNRLKSQMEDFRKNSMESESEIRNQLSVITNQAATLSGLLKECEQS